MQIFINEDSGIQFTVENTPLNILERSELDAKNHYGAEKAGSGRTHNKMEFALECTRSKHEIDRKIN